MMLGSDLCRGGPRTPNKKGSPISGGGRVGSDPRLKSNSIVGIRIGSDPRLKLISMFEEFRGLSVFRNVSEGFEENSTNIKGSGDLRS